MLVRVLSAFLLAIAVVLSPSAHAADAGHRLKIGITLHPYYSFAVNIVGDRADVIPLITSDANPHGYQPRPDDMRRATSLDVLIVNGIGHDEWAFEIIQAAGRNDSLPLIYANNSVALLPTAGDTELIANPHTFVSIAASIQQVYEIARRLGELDPDNAVYYRENAQGYGARLRRFRAEYMAKLAMHDTSNFRCATMHGAYDYMMQEFGLNVSAVIEPRHGVNPTARQLAQTIDDIKAANVNVLFAELYFSNALAETIQSGTGVNVYSFSHIDSGEFTATKFDEEMRKNLDTLLDAVEYSLTAE